MCMCGPGGGIWGIEYNVLKERMERRIYTDSLDIWVHCENVWAVNNVPTLKSNYFLFTVNFPLHKE